MLVKGRKCDLRNGEQTNWISSMNLSDINVHKFKERCSFAHFLKTLPQTSFKQPKWPETLRQGLRVHTKDMLRAQLRLTGYEIKCDVCCMLRQCRYITAAKNGKMRRHPLSLFCHFFSHSMNNSVAILSELYKCYIKCYIKQLSNSNCIILWALKINNAEKNEK